VHHVEVRDRKSNVNQVVVEISYRRFCILPPIGKQKRYPARASDPPPGNTVMWRGLLRLADI